MIPAETRWAVLALRRALERMERSREVLIEDETWALDPESMFAATAEALMWIVMLDDWYGRDHSDDYQQLKTEMGSLLLGLRWARNRTLHDFAVLTGFIRARRKAQDTIHPGWQYRDVLPLADPKFNRGAGQYDGRVAGRPLLEPMTEIANWFEGWIELELPRRPSAD